MPNDQRTEREKLVKELTRLDSNGELLYGPHGELNYERIADFILADRKKIVEPLVEYMKLHCVTTQNLVKAINQTLKNAGVSND